MRYGRPDYDKNIIDLRGVSGDEVWRRWCDVDTAPGGSLTEAIPPDEPVFLIRGRDVAAPQAINAYADLAAEHGASDFHVESARAWAAEVHAWQNAHQDRVEVPDRPPQQCRRCGCTDEDCSECIGKTGYACHWVEADLCSRCASEAPSDTIRRSEARLREEISAAVKAASTEPEAHPRARCTGGPRTGKIETLFALSFWCDECGGEVKIRGFRRGRHRAIELSGVTCTLCGATYSVELESVDDLGSVAHSVRPTREMEVEARAGSSETRGPEPGDRLNNGATVLDAFAWTPGTWIAVAIRTGTATPFLIVTIDRDRKSLRTLAYGTLAAAFTAYERVRKEGLR